MHASRLMRMAALPARQSHSLRRGMSALCAVAATVVTPHCSHSPVLQTPCRARSFQFYLNLEDPDDTRRCVEEQLERLMNDNRRDTTAFLHALLNLTLSYYQAEDYIKAREFAEYTHRKAFEHNPHSALVFLTAKSCARCAAALATYYEQHVAKVEQRAEISASLAPRASVLVSAQRAIRKLRADAVRYERIAQRLYNRPDLAFLRGWGQGFTQDAKGEKRSCDARTAWSEDVGSVDEESEPAYGPRWQARRSRPEHVELTQHARRTVGANGWTIPK